MANYETLLVASGSWRLWRRRDGYALEDKFDDEKKLTGLSAMDVEAIGEIAQAVEMDDMLRQKGGRDD